MDISTLYAHYLQFPLVVTDTRQLQPDCLFFALKGSTFNGNDFASQALEAGAQYAIVDEQPETPDERYILVEDVLKTLQDLAAYHREHLKIPVIGITGTNGKTTTKELLYAVLNQKYRVFATKGNLNNHIGVPLSLLSITKDIELAIIEMGANHQGEIKQLCLMAQPDFGLITNVGKAHLEGFGGFEGVKTAKGELYDYLANSGKHVFIQADNPHLMEMVASRSFSHSSFYGFSEHLEISGKLIKADPMISIQWKARSHSEKYQVSLQMTGAYNVENVIAAIAVGTCFGLLPEQINTGLAAYQPANQRSQIVQTQRHNTLICDYYNANASSMDAALKNIMAIEAEAKILILGDMFELGEDSYVEHLHLVEKALQLNARRTLFVGAAFYEVKREGAEFYKTTADAVKALQTQIIEHSFVLVKASRGMKFEQLIPLL